MSDEITIECPYRSIDGKQPICRIVAELTDLPIGQCHTNDSACAHCLQSDIAPQAPNAATASMAIGAAQRTGGEAGFRDMLNRMKPHLRQFPPPTEETTPCVLRGPEVRKAKCKPCQADSLTPVMVPVYDCPKHNVCTIRNTGLFPKIQACSTCQDRLEKYYALEAKPTPPEVLTAIAERNQARSTNNQEHRPS